MMEYERLTYRRIRDGHAYAKAEYGDFEVVDRLAELEDKIEQGTLIELADRRPLMWGKDGDTIHCQHCGEDLMGAFDGDTEVIQCPKCGGFVYGLFAEDYNEAKLKELKE